MYANAALSDPSAEPGTGGGASGGPDVGFIDVWKAAPHLALVAPDIYNSDAKTYAEYLTRYRRPDNPLMIPETGNSLAFARFFWAALGHNAIGFSPFGFDDTGYSNYPLGAKRLDDATVEAFASKYRLFAPMARTWADIALHHPVWEPRRAPMRPISRSRSAAGRSPRNSINGRSASATGPSSRGDRRRPPASPSAASPSRSSAPTSSSSPAPACGFGWAPPIRRRPTA
jgi:hypothetical protein